MGDVKRSKGSKKPERQVPVPVPEGQVLTPWGMKIKSSTRKPMLQENETRDTTPKVPAVSEASVVPEASSVTNLDISTTALNMEAVEQVSTEISREFPQEENKVVEKATPAPTGPKTQQVTKEQQQLEPEVVLKPILKQEKEAVVLDKTSETRLKSKKQVETVEVPVIQLKKTPQSKKLEDAPKEQVFLKPIPKKITEPTALDEKDKTIVSEDTSKTQLQIELSEDKGQSEVPLQKTPSPKHPEEIPVEPVTLKSVPKKETKEVSEEAINLKPVPKKEPEQVVPEETTKTPWRTKKQPKAEEVQPEVQLKKIPQPKPSDETPMEEVNLKPIPKREPEEAVPEEITLKPIPKKEPEQVAPEETAKTPWRSKKQPKMEEVKPEIQLKKVPQPKPSEETPVEEVSLKPIPKRKPEEVVPEEVTLKPVSKKEPEQVVPEEKTKTPWRSKKHPKAEEVQPEIQLKKIPQPKPSEETPVEEVSLKPIPKKEEEDVPVEDTNLKPVPKKEPEQVPEENVKTPWRTKKQPKTEEVQPEVN